MISTIQKKATETSVGLEMKKMGGVRSSAQLYAQFIYKINTISSNLDICFFSPSLIFVGDSLNGLRENIFKTKTFTGGFVMNSNNFADVAEWPLTFSILSSKK